MNHHSANCMITRTIHNWIFYVAILVLPLSAMAQGITVKVSADRQQILIGEPIRVTIEADIPDTEIIRFFQFDSIPHFEFLERQKIDTVNTANGTILSQVMQVTSFDSGHWVIPAFVLTADIMTDSIPVDVGYSGFDRNQPYHDVKDIVEVHAPKPKDYSWLYYAGGGLLVLIIALYFLFGRKKPAVKIVASPKADPYQTAIKGLEQLSKQKKDPKKYYSALVDIFRVYLQERAGVHSLQTTTDDLVMQLRQLKLPAMQDESLPAALRLSDFVKFAKYVPGENDDQSAFTAIRNAIVTIEKTNAGETASKQE